MTRLLLLAFLILPLATHAAGLININTADAATLEMLPGIGTTYAERIVDYRAANGPFVTTEDIENVSGIGPSTFAKITSLITVGDTSTDTSTTTSPTSTASSTIAAPAARTYVPPPSALQLHIHGEHNNFVEVPVTFSVSVQTASGASDANAQVAWSFGDGSAQTGSVVTKLYHYAGTYLVVATAHDGSTRARAEFAVTIAPAAVHIARVSDVGVTLANESDTELDLSGWRLTSSRGLFQMPPGTALLPHAQVLFPFAVMNWPVMQAITLTYPDGVVAAHYPALAAEVTTTPPVQPKATLTSYKKTKTVDTISSNQAPGFSHAATVIAPAAPAKAVAAGAHVSAKTPTPTIAMFIRPITVTSERVQTSTVRTADRTPWHWPPAAAALVSRATAMAF